MIGPACINRNCLKHWFNHSVILIPMSRVNLLVFVLLTVITLCDAGFSSEAAYAVRRLRRRSVNEDGPIRAVYFTTVQVRQMRQGKPVMTSVNVPKMVNAVIRKRHFRANVRTNFGSHYWVTTQMEAMNAASDDEKGHFIGSQFSGPIAWYNLNPQHKDINRNEGNQVVNSYYDVEKRVATFLSTAGPNAEVMFDVVAIPIEKARPDAFLVRIKCIGSNGRPKGGTEETLVLNSKRLRS